MALTPGIERREVIITRTVTPGLPGLREWSLPAVGMYLVTDNGRKYRIPYAPRDIERTGYAHRWDEVDRAGRKPLVRHEGDTLTRLKFDLHIQHRTGQTIEPDLTALTGIADSAATVTITGMSRAEAGPWRVEALNIQTSDRDPYNQARTATVTVQLVEAYDVRVTSLPKPLPAKQGPVTGGAVKPPAVPPKPTATYYTVRAGDTLSGIAVRFYGRADLWTKIATANKIRNPRWISVGQRLIIPPK